MHNDWSRFWGFFVTTMALITRVGRYKANFLRSVISLIVQIYKNTGYLLNIMSVFDKCRCSFAAEKPDEYECDSNYITYNSTKSKFALTGKSMNGALVNPSSLCCWVWWFTNMGFIYQRVLLGIRTTLNDKTRGRAMRQWFTLPSRALPIPKLPTRNLRFEKKTI